MSEVTKKENRIKVKCVKSFGVTLIVDKMKTNRLKWFWHVMRKEETEAVRAVIKINVKKKKEKNPEKEMVEYN